MKKICEFSGLLIYQQDQEICKENLPLVESFDCADEGQSYSRKTLSLNSFFFFQTFCCSNEFEYSVSIKGNIVFEVYRIKSVLYDIIHFKNIPRIRVLPPTYIYICIKSIEWPFLHFILHWQFALAQVSLNMNRNSCYKIVC